MEANRVLMLMRGSSPWTRKGSTLRQPLYTRRLHRSSNSFPSKISGQECSAPFSIRTCHAPCSSSIPINNSSYHSLINSSRPTFSNKLTSSSSPSSRCTLSRSRGSLFTSNSTMAGMRISDPTCSTAPSIQWLKPIKSRKPPLRSHPSLLLYRLYNTQPIRTACWRRRSTRYLGWRTASHRTEAAFKTNISNIAQ